MSTTSTSKLVLKFVIAVILYYCGLIAVVAFLKRTILGGNRYIILMYHRVLERNDETAGYVQPGMVVTNEIFERQLAFLSKKYRLVGMRKLAGYIINKQIPEYCLAITFDDGWADNYTNAYPILKNYNLPATIFLTADYVNTDDEFWFSKAGRLVEEDNLPRRVLAQLLKKFEVKSESIDISTIEGKEDIAPGLSDSDWFIEKLKKLDSTEIDDLLTELEVRGGSKSEGIRKTRSMLSWDEVVEMNKNGIEFGSHGCSHRILSGLPDEELEREIAESKRIIEKNLGSEIGIFAYPNGDYDNKVKSMVKNGGYICALATSAREEGSRSDIFSLRRINVHDGISVGPGGNFSRAMFSFHIFRNS